jgi:hypothetical protein
MPTHLILLDITMLTIVGEEYKQKNYVPNAAYKVHAKVITRRLNTINEHVLLLLEEHRGFCKAVLLNRRAAAQ